MGLVRRILLAALVILGMARMIAYFIYASMTLTSPLEAYHFESKMVLLAYRAELGESLYPDWRDYPHVANFYAPLYFGLTGLLGSQLGADIPDLFKIGRAISFTSGLLSSLVLGGSIARRYGRGAALAGMVTSLGAVPMIGFSIMARPDTLAELLGLIGFFLSGHRTRAWRLAGCIALILAAMTKQTAVIFLLAAALALAAEGRRGRALAVLGGSLTGLLTVVLAVTLLVEPNFASSLAGESKTPWSRDTGLAVLRSLVLGSPDLLLLPVVGLCLWLRRGIEPWERRAAALTMVLLAGSLGLAWKRGASANYYLSLRAAEALAVGTLWHAAHLQGGRRRSAAMLGVVALATLSLVPGTLFTAVQARYAWDQAALAAGPVGRTFLYTYQRAIGLARDPKVHLLTDSGLVDLYQGKRAASGDPWQFRNLVETGQLRPTRMREMIDSQYYDYIITHADIFSSGYESYPFGLPMGLIERARVRYVRDGNAPGLFFYRRRTGADDPRT